MKIVGGVLFIAACFVANTHSFPSDRDSDLSSEYDISDMMGNIDIFRSLFWRMKSEIDRFTPFFNGQMFNTVQGIPLDNMLNWNFTKNDANWTSETKVIDGNVITTNETIYTGNNNYSTLIMRIRIIEVEPENETNPVTEADNAGFEVVTLSTATESTSETNTGTTNRKESTSPTRSVETVEEFDNEISKDQNPLTA